MKILRAYRVKLDPTVEQRKLMARQAGAARFAYNWALAAWRAQYEKVKIAKEQLSTQPQPLPPSPSAYGVHKQLTVVKRTPELSWLREVSAYVVREAVMDLGDAYKHFFRKLKAHGRGDHHECKPDRAGRCQLGEPQFRGRNEPAGRGFRIAQPQAVRVTATTTRRGTDRVSVAGVGDVRISWDHRGKIPLGSNCRGLAVRQVAGDWYAAVQVEEEHEENEPILSRAGVEVGVRVLTVTTDAGSVGVPIRDLPNLAREKRRLALWSRRMARRHVKGKKSREQSKGWHECVHRVQQIHVRITDMRKDAIHQATTRIVRKANSGVLVLRDSRVQGMISRAGKEGSELRKRNALAPSVAQSAMFEVRRQIEYKQKWNGGETVIAPNDYPSTRRCSNCGAVRETDPGYPNFHCPACGTTSDREENSARNLRQYDPFAPKNTSGRNRRGDSPSESGSDAVQRPDEPDHSAAEASSAPTTSPDDAESESSTGVLGTGNRAAAKAAETDAMKVAIQPEGEHLPHAIPFLSRTSAEVVHRTRSRENTDLRAGGDGATGTARKSRRNAARSLGASRERSRS